jgi:hypothetical protein
MYLSIWTALTLFAAGEAGRAWLGGPRSARGWPLWCWAAGIALCATHFALAFEVRHGWSHAAAIRATAAQTAAVYGIDWGGGFWVNYVFLAVWAVDAWHWRARAGARRSAAVTWALRAFYCVILLNAAVIFAAGWRRAIGAVIVGVLAIAWIADPSPRRRTASRSNPREQTVNE